MQSLIQTGPVPGGLNYTNYTVGLLLAYYRLSPKIRGTFDAESDTASQLDSQPQFVTICLIDNPSAIHPLGGMHGTVFSLITGLLPIESQNQRHFWCRV